MAWKDSLEENEIEESGGEKKSGGAKTSRKSIMPTLLIGLWLVALTVLLVFLFIKAPPKLTDIKMGNSVTKKINPPDASDSKITDAMNKMDNLDKKIVQVDEQMKNLEKNIGERFAQIENRNKEFETLIERVDKLETTVLSAVKNIATVRTAGAEKLPESIKSENITADNTAGEKTAVKETSETETKVKSDVSPEKRTAKAAASAGKKRVAKAEKKTSSGKSAKKRKPSHTVAYKSPMEREDAVAEYWLKRNKPDYSPENESENRPLYGKSTGQSSPSGYQVNKDATSDLPVETVSGPGYEPVGTKTETYLKTPDPKIPGVKYHQIGEGETITDIGKQYNMTSKEIIRMNKVARGSSFYPGERIQILPDGGFDNVGPRVSLNQISRQYDPVYGLPQREIDKRGKLAPGLGIYTEWELW